MPCQAMPSIARRKRDDVHQDPIPPPSTRHATTRTLTDAQTSSHSLSVTLSSSSGRPTDKITSYASDVMEGSGTSCSTDIHRISRGIDRWAGRGQREGEREGGNSAGHAIHPWNTDTGKQTDMQECVCACV
uniref:Uncharacterized protein n=1 Tax=Vitrella brassicaformis TaxID=1169539 RepID=A0A7S1NYN1_9ALVE|mmetsp:Transcript_16094/g.38445  ORF Transcript_16094/g.38445 Transcript_16094/m.38445 type:complete len:131 (+) Transcript_16094:219-611(+)